MWVPVDKFDSYLRDLETWIRSHEGYEEVNHILKVFREDVEDALRYAYVLTMGTICYHKSPSSIYPEEYIRDPLEIRVIIHEKVGGVEQFHFADFPMDVKLWMADSEGNAELQDKLPPMQVSRLNFIIHHSIIDGYSYFYISTGDKYLWADGTVHDGVVRSNFEFYIQGRFRELAEAEQVLDAYNAKFEV